MVRRIFTLLFSLFLILGFGYFEMVYACSCMPTAPCQSFARADVVFIGKVTGSKLQRTTTEYEQVNAGTPEETYIEKAVTYDVGEIYFEVIEGIKAAEKGSTITINSSTGGGDCGAWFKRGDTYVVFASKEGSTAQTGISSLTYGGDMAIERKPDPERLWTTLCAGNRELDHAEDELVYLKNLPKPGDGAQIVGTIFESINDYSEENLTGKPMPATKIRVKRRSGGNDEYVGISDAKGKFSITVPPGKYIAEPVIDDTLSYSDRYSKDPIEFEVTDLKCEVKTFWVENNSRIAGKAVDHRGTPVNDITLHLTPVEKNKRDSGFNNYWAGVYENGEFEFNGIPAGRYHLSLNYTEKPDEEAPYSTTFYPLKHNRKEAQVIEIGPGTKINGLKFAVPQKLKKLPLIGTVLWKDGQPAAGAEVDLIDVEFERSAFFDKPVADDSGQFQMEWFGGRKYKLEVIVWQKEADGSGYGIGHAETEEFILTNDTQEFRIVLDTTDPRKDLNFRTVAEQRAGMTRFWELLTPLFRYN
ncbi:MAG: hypothetical protein KF685_10625 [Acidobacteria bacterium]|nr:hypothetical protein [Acidobacteriota bacterium]